MTQVRTERIDAGGTAVQVLRHGSGRPLVFLDYVDAESGGAEWLPVHARLAERFEVFVPVRPPASEVTDRRLRSAADHAFLYHDVLDALALDGPTVVAVSAAGWIAAEIAVSCPHAFGRLVLADAAGLRVESERPPDIFAIPLDEVRRLLFTGPAGAGNGEGPDYAMLSRVKLFARIGWNPYLYDPGLERRLARVRVPTLVLWGADDRLFPASYARAFGTAIPGARVELIPGSGHLPALERPDDFAERIVAWMGASRS